MEENNDVEIVKLTDKEGLVILKTKKAVEESIRRQEAFFEWLATRQPPSQTSPSHQQSDNATHETTS